jgi:Tfp pilus assembly protein PilX
MNRLFRRRDERGMALVTVIMLSMIATLFVTTTMYVAFHDQTSSAHNRSWGQALHVAESGVHEAIAYLQNSGGVVPSSTQSGTTTEGTWQYRVVASSRNRYQIDAVGTVGNSGALQASRRLRVTMAPPLSFKYALFSESDVTTKNNNNICGDVYAATYVQVYNGDAVRASTSPSCPAGGSLGSGNVTAATGYIAMDNNSIVEGTAWSGGYDSSGYGINSSGSIGGDAKASCSDPTCIIETGPDSGHTKYKITGGSVAGNATAWGSISGTVAGTKTPNQYTGASETKPIPTFIFNSANYPAATLHTYAFPSGYAAFNSYIAANKSNLSGTFYITGGGSSTPVDLGGVTVSGDLTVIAAQDGSGYSSPIDASGGIGASGTNDKVVVLASWYTPPGCTSTDTSCGCTTQGGNPKDCAIGIKNNFSPSSSSLTGGDNTAVLLYAPNGPIAFKNNADFQGAVYANNIQVKNNMNVTYDAKIGQLVGFGATTLQITDWQECDPGSVTSSSCQ